MKHRIKCREQLWTMEALLIFLHSSSTCTPCKSPVCPPCGPLVCSIDEVEMRGYNEGQHHTKQFHVGIYLRWGKGAVGRKLSGKERNESKEETLSIYILVMA